VGLYGQVRDLKRKTLELSVLFRKTREESFLPLHLVMRGPAD